MAAIEDGTVLFRQGRRLPADFDPAVVTAIDARLARIADNRGARLLMAIESGSRAWGFPSPDSDYDCRFLYVRPAREYASLVPLRDVIEFPLEGDLDVNGWDLRKALKLALKGNAVIVEWATAPIRYCDPDGFQARLASLLEHIVDPRLAARHYAGLISTGLGHVDIGAPFPLKKLFYLLRPIAALMWMRDRGWKKLPPMRFQDLVGDIELSGEECRAIEDLLAAKSATRELGTGCVPQALTALIARGDQVRGDLPPRPSREGWLEPAVKRADTFLLAEIQKLGA
ncbi:nucleotidyltransferase domain-containing protein [Oryzibacter oryziterrae]|uniref:nucleotidyltransferase domain-containing protein n=1 Tax=Oryzibacter oryziterrae TaxID=2766474 RepID=UPI001F47CC81|nr:nucleotidyltransferase domain-containing protein [Oryzibacter oryziterrae]